MPYYYQSPIGVIAIYGKGNAVTRIALQESPDIEGAELHTTPGDEAPFAKELDLYFKGMMHSFNAIDEAPGSAFNKKVWKAIARIPYGAVKSYKEIAEEIGHPKAARAVGNACAKNPLPIVVPCHRVVGKTRPFSYTGGAWRKEWLLAHEQKCIEVREAA